MVNSQAGQSQQVRTYTLYQRVRFCLGQNERRDRLG